MTLVITGIGTDGVVIASDRCESSEASNKFVDKIYHLKSGSLFSFAGDLGVAQKIMDGINTIDLSNEPFLSQVVSVENVAKDVNRRYKRNGGVSAHFFMSMTDDNGRPVIMFYDDDGTSLKIDSYDTIGSGSSAASYFLKTLYRSDMTCDELAQIFSFIITLVSQSDINSSVKVSREYPPEIYIINSLNARKPYRFENDFAYDINSDKIKSLNNFVNNLFHVETIQIESVKRYF